MLISKYRDLTFLRIKEDTILTIACDSCAGIGNSELDIVKIDNEVVGYFTARVCLFETLCTQATPLIVINNLGVEMQKRGIEIMRGITKAIDEYNKEGFSTINLEDSLTGSTEENIKALQTSLGITVIGEKKIKDRLKIHKGSKVIAIGIPKVGPEVIDDIENNRQEIVSFHSLGILLSNKDIMDIVPVGSKGIAYEVSVLESTNNIKINLYNDCKLDLNKSSGPATTVLAILRTESLSGLKDVIKEPINLIGEVI